MPHINDPLPPHLVESYRQHEKLLYHISHQFPQAGTLEDRLSLASEAWLRAFHTYNPHNEQGASFTTWVRYKVEKILLEEIRERTEVYTHLKQYPVGGLEASRRHERFDIEKFLRLLSPDAVEVVQTAIRMQARHPQNMWWRLFLIFDRLGWQHHRIVAAFDEVEENLP